MVKVNKKADNPLFIDTLPAKLTGRCDACGCEVETEGNEKKDGNLAQWHSTEDKGQGRTVQGWQVKCPTPRCSAWISVD